MNIFERIVNDLKNLQYEHHQEETLLEIEEINSLTNDELINIMFNFEDSKLSYYLKKHKNELSYYMNYGYVLDPYYVYDQTIDKVIPVDLYIDNVGHEVLRNFINMDTPECQNEQAPAPERVYVGEGKWHAKRKNGFKLIGDVERSSSSKLSVDAAIDRMVDILNLLGVDPQDPVGDITFLKVLMRLDFEDICFMEDYDRIVPFEDILEYQKYNIEGVEFAISF